MSIGRTIKLPSGGAYFVAVIVTAVRPFRIDRPMAADRSDTSLQQSHCLAEIPEP
ncbi:hypothetical protein HSBGL_2593 [Halapricum desulfuricans]|uniref:Uncharacterized protein n=1 Tax=Halapricum desulfuricans TaxID=2841257 RepID=A0A897NS16_9EURY|nr:hypothetical protein HSBGL_2593 [Halapricum desulfuricans]